MLAPIVEEVLDKVLKVTVNPDLTFDRYNNSFHMYMDIERLIKVDVRCAGGATTPMPTLSPTVSPTPPTPAPTTQAPTTAAPTTAKPTTATPTTPSTKTVSGGTLAPTPATTANP